MSPDYLAVLRAVRELHLLATAGREDTPEADAIRDAADAAWGRLTGAERTKIGEVSEGLYRVGGDAVGADLDDPQRSVLHS